MDHVTVLIADDHPLNREGTARAIAEHPQLELVATCEDGREALETTLRLRPDVAVLDVRMPHLSGDAVLSALNAEGAETRVVFLTMMLDAPLVHDALSSGAAGYLSKEADRTSVNEAVLAAARGEIVLSPEAQRAVAGALRHRRTLDVSSLSDREVEILGLMASGHTASAIGRRLHLSPATVKSHQHNIYGKLGVSTGPAAVFEATRRGVLA
jgi:two-component system nitrate/nitrite response regulator NarL